MIDVELDKGDLDRTIRRLTKYNTRVRNGVIKQVRHSALKIQSNARMRVPVASNRLRSSIATRFVVGGLGAVIGSNISYAQFVEKGRKPGGFPPISALIVWVNTKITRNPKLAKAIAFLIGRKIAAFGTKAQPFLIPAYKREKKVFVNNIRKLLKIS